MSIDMSQFYQVFFEESEEHLAAMESLLLGLDVDNPDVEELNAIFRAAHSIKGSAGTFGFTDLAETTHILENLLDRIRKSELALRPEMVDAFLQAGDILRTMLDAHQGRGVVDAADVEVICHRLKELSTGELAASKPLEGAGQVTPPAQDGQDEVAVRIPPDQGYRCYNIQFVPTRIATQGVGVENLLEELRSLGELQVLSQPVENDGEPGYWDLRLLSHHPQADFVDQIDFVAENGAWRVSEDKAVARDGSTAFGFFSGSPGIPDEARGYGLYKEEAKETEEAYGFFTPVEPSGVEEDPGFGFFEPVNVAEAASENVPAVVDELDGAYGFFEPLQQPSVNAEVVEEGDGFGFFAPLSAVDPENIAKRQIPVLAVTKDTPKATQEAAIVDAPSSPVVKPVAVAASVSPISGGADKTEQKSPTTAVRSSSAKPPAAAAGGDSSIRVSVEKVDQLINLVGELVITQAMLLQTSAQMQEAAPERLLNGLAQLERNTRDLQEAVMSIRMMPISFVFSRFPRVVRDLSGKLGKQVELKTQGETTELDKSLIERITDPLTHLIRNSLDHGIESPEKRVAAGKSPTGTITLKAYHQGGNIVIEVGDDGAGLPRDKILKKARERGLPVSDQMSDQEVFNLIFEAGFSTAEQVTDVSGRGVGMDVVRRNIQSMGGRVEIDSIYGVGTRMTVRLPLTLAILDGMSVAVGDQIYILPLSYVLESMQPQAGEIKTLSNQGRVVQVRGEYLPVVVLHELFHLKSTWRDLTQGIMVVLDADGTRVALFVDALLGQHQVVIKSLEANYRKVPGISGATIMGDGHVALILDVSAIAAMAKKNVQKAA